MQAPSNELFRFVALRAPDRRSLSPWLARHPELEGAIDSPFIEELREAAQAAEPGAERLRIAQQWLAQNGVSAVGDLSESDLAQLRNVARTPLPKSRDAAELRGHIEGLLGGSVDGYSDSRIVDAWRAPLWDGLVATVLASASNSGQHDDMLTAFRGLEMAHRAAAGLGAKEVRAAHALQPVFPRWLFPSPPQADGSATPRPATPPKLVQISPELLDSLEGLYTAMHAIEAQQLKVRRETQQVAVRAHVVGKPGPRKDGVFPDNSPFQRPWVFDEDSVEALTAETRKALDGAGVALAGRPIDDVLAEIQGRIGAFSAALTRQVGPKPIVSLGRKLAATRTSSRAVLPIVSGLPQGGLGGGGDGGLLEDLEEWRRELLDIQEDLDEIPRGVVRSVGLADLKLVRRTLLAYEAAEVAHIENVLASERKDRTHRRRHFTEQTLIVEEERDEETERDLQTAERFELQRESEKTLEEDMDLDAGVTVTGRYGMVTVEAHADFAFSRSSTEAQRSSAVFARDVTDRSLRRVRERVRTERSRRTVDEVEETNVHGFNNEEGPEHVVGIYRYVEQVYEAQIINYGRRMMLEFFVPEPAAFYIEEVLTAPTDTEGLRQPPSIDDLVPSDIRPESYMALVQLYRVEDASPPPPQSQIVGIALEKQPTDDRVSTKADMTLKIPPGYVAKQAFFQYGASWRSQPWWLTVMAGQAHFHRGESSYTYTPGMNDERAVVPIAVRSIELTAYALTIEVRCERTDEHLQEWQLNTYGKIVTAHNAQQQAFEEARRSRAVTGDPGIVTHAPARNREIEREELKKSAISLLSGTRYEELQAMVSEAGPFGYPEILGEESRELGDRVRFFEQALEWRQMAYVFYPYFWGRKGGWRERQGLDDPDPMFGRFLRAGAARVVVPVRPGFPEAVAHFLATGERWDGAEPPVVDDPLYVPIIDELREADDAPREGVPENDPWELRVPTPLVWLQAHPQLPDWREEE